MLSAPPSEREGNLMHRFCAAGCRCRSREAVRQRHHCRQGRGRGAGHSREDEDEEEEEVPREERMRIVRRSKRRRVQRVIN